jgi:hypothetical protein
MGKQENFMTSDNPFSPPTTSDSHATSSADYRYSGTGVYCDRGTLVLSRSKYQLPAICLKTGEPTDGTFPIQTKMLGQGQGAAIAIAGGAIGYAIARSLFGTEFDLKIPLKQDWVNPDAPTAAKMKRSWGVVAIGFALILLGIGLSLVSEAFIVLCAIGMIVGIVGLFVGGYKSSRKPYSITSFNDKFIWLDGVDKTLAMQFEPLPKT